MEALAPYTPNQLDDDNFMFLCDLCETSNYDPCLFCHPFCNLNDTQKDNGTRAKSDYADTDIFNTSLITCHATICGYRPTCIIDTGATSNYISLNVFNSHNFIDQQIVYETSKEHLVRLGDNRNVQCAGIVTLPVTVDNRIIPTKFLVMNELAYDMILGMPFLHDNKVVIDNETKTFTFKENAVLLLTTTQELILPPCYEGCVPVDTSQLGANTVLISSYEPLTLRKGIFAARGILDPGINSLILLANLSHHTVTLPIGTIVAEAEVDVIAHIQDDNSRTTETDESKCGNNQDSYVDNDFLNKFTLKLDHLDNQQIKQVHNLLCKYSDLFDVDKKSTATVTMVEHEIDTGNTKPIHQPPNRVGPAQRKIMKLHVDEMLKNKVIQPSNSPYAAPVILVGKKDGGIRFCVDYRRLNSCTVRDVYPLPRIDDCLASLRGASYFSTLDAINAYWQIPLAKKDRHKTAFITPDGLYEFLVLPYGLTNAPATFQRFMDSVLAGLKWNILLVYLDDINVFSSSFEKHLLDLEQVFERLRQANIKLKSSKCHFFERKILYLGHIVSEQGIQPDPDKIKAVVEKP